SDKMSPADKEQTNSFLNSIYDFYLGNVASSRKMDVKRLEVISDSMLVHNSTDALKLGLVDGLKYYDEVESELRKRIKIGAKDKIKFVGLKKFASSLDFEEKEEKSKNKVAIIYAEGDIVMGNGDENSIGSEKLSSEIRKAKNDENVKAIVLRINSPGGSALASDIIWREVKLSAQSKTVIASMSDVAASGGYYIAMACDTIVAQPNSVTGSIGVFGVLLNMKNFLKNKLGITTDRVNTGYFSDLPNATRDLTAFEKKSIQAEVENIYDVFTKKAAEGRGMTQEELKKLASGRVWSGLEAKQNGLVDELGGLEKAIQIAVAKAKLGKDYELVNYPEEKRFLEKVLSSFGGDAETQLEKELGTEAKHHFQTIKKVKTLQGVQARMPYELVIH
ncbi:MAG: signal peptide peptidase SppA, partial [Cytophagales bacterium]|nr:signal peptide peptidase SppA [Cytophagales bacterium]